jgi:hypothetical protein
MESSRWQQVRGSSLAFFASEGRLTASSLDLRNREREERERGGEPEDEFSWRTRSSPSDLSNFSSVDEEQKGGKPESRSFLHKIPLFPGPESSLWPFLLGAAPLFGWNSVVIAQGYLASRGGFPPMFLALSGLAQNLPSLFLMAGLLAAERKRVEPGIHAGIYGPLAVIAAIAACFAALVLTRREFSPLLQGVVWGLIALNGVATGLSSASLFAAVATSDSKLSMMVAGAGFGALAPSAYEIAFWYTMEFRTAVALLFALSSFFTAVFTAISVRHVVRLAPAIAAGERQPLLTNDESQASKQENEGPPSDQALPWSVWLDAAMTCATEALSIGVLGAAPLVPENGITGLSTFLIAGYNLGDLAGRQLASRTTVILSSRASRVPVLVLAGARVIVLLLAVSALVAYGNVFRGEFILSVCFFFVVAATNGVLVVALALQAQAGVADLGVKSGTHQLAASTAKLCASSLQLGIVAGFGLSFAVAPAASLWK